MEPVNSKDYWESRFHNGDWDQYDGEGQSAFFAELARDALPAWLCSAMKRHDWNVADWGCAEGAGTAVLAKAFPACHFTGFDFSEAAIKKAKELYPSCEFATGNLLGEIASSDVIFSSNTLEHFKGPDEILHRLVSAANEHAILLLPLHDDLDVKEHFSRFDEEFFPLELEGHSLSYFQEIDCAGNPLWPGEQLLLVYSAPQALPQERRLSDLFSNIEYLRLRERWTAVRAECAETSSQLNTAQAERDEVATQLAAARAECAETSSQLNTAQAERDEVATQLAAVRAECAETSSQLNTAQAERDEVATQLAAARAECAETSSQLNTAQAERDEVATQLAAARAECNKAIAQLTGQVAELQQQLTFTEGKVASAIQQLHNMTASRLFKLVHLLNRWKYQGHNEDSAERKKFRKWLFSRFRHAPDRDHRFHPLFSVIHLLEAERTETPIVPMLDGAEGKLAQHLHEQSKNFDDTLSSPLSKEAKKLRQIMVERKYKGILVYPHVVFWEPLQTPQQLLRAFAKEGWLCFFCEHPNVKNACREVEPNLFITYESDLIQAIGDTPVTVLFTWIGSTAFAEHISSKTIWYHILNHLQISPYYDDLYERLHTQTLAAAETVSYVARPLRQYTEKRPDAVYLPNGANAAEISNIHEGFVPADMVPIVATGHKIVGYYGYLAEWMDYAMVRQMAQRCPDREFVFVGKAIHDTSMIEDLPNVHLLGLKPYKELSDYAKFFDVATIPFLVDEKMDCVSPIKFYEYLALGKPVVSSFMKELEPYSCKCSYIACAKGIDEFLFYIDKSMQPEVQTAAKENGPLLAAQNSWQARAQAIEQMLSINRKAMLDLPYTKPDVIILAIIDYDFRHQRPQHFAQRLAQKGHRVFYVNANYAAEYAQKPLENNLWQVTLQNSEAYAIHLTDWSKNIAALRSQLDRMMGEDAIRDAVVIVDYPNWVYGALYLREKYGLRMVTDYMDDFTGFLNPAEALVRKNCELLLKESDGVMASSQFLYDIAAKYSDHVAMNRNGTEYAYFHQAWEAQPAKKERTVIGYYGAIAEWFNAEIVCRCAERFPECDIVLVGNITEHRKQLEQYSNIRLVGEVPYAKLLPWLQSFDVCLIPFDASTDLIKATNPVKFYEYLSAGKKIVATEIPELEPYRGKFAYLENDAEKFCDAVAACLDGTDTLAPAAERFAFAQENDWDVRAQVFEQEALAVYPKISVIVLCYNQLDYTKQCVESVLKYTAYPSYELVIVDNASSDGTADYLRQVAAASSNVKIVLNETNRGFAGGNNDGIAVADGDYLVLLNNDTLVTRGWLTGLLKHFRKDGAVGLVGPVTNSIGNEAKINVSYQSIQAMPSFADAYTFRHMREEYPHHGILAMFCLMISRELYEKAGPLDEQYGVGMFEDDDYSTASERLGYRNVMAEDVFIHHFGNVSFNKLEDTTYRTLFKKNKAYYEQKWNEPWKQPHYRPGVL